MSLSKQEGSKGPHEKTFIGKIILVPIDTSNQDPEVDSKEEDT
jgi:hypothetical protein